MTTGKFMKRRQFLHFASWAVAAPARLRQAWAQTFPTRPVRIIVPFAAGGPTDATARIFADLLSARWRGQPAIVEDRPGAGTIVGSAVAAKSPADGYTTLFGNTAFFINAAIGQKLPYDPVKDFVCIGQIGVSELALVANKSFPPNTISELVAFAKQSPDPLNYTSPGPRTATHLAGEWLKQLAGIRMQHINYNGSAPALTDVISGRVPLMIDVLGSARPHVESGALKLIATAGRERSRDFPQVPAIAETFAGFDVVGITFMVAPAGVPAAVVESLWRDVNAVVTSKEYAERAHPLGIDAKGSTPQERDRLIRREIARWTEIARVANVSAE
jgi:tripartite-type tricarboxylate transporter receptor subunit TctC